ncbi:hypothetical protein CHCC20331_3982 [Bacillus paralicheniformis]|nr:hypothetical protein CHCC20331_3982 [Bacillus paralicheniformis]
MKRNLFQQKMKDNVENENKKSLNQTSFGRLLFALLAN